MALPSFFLPAVCDEMKKRPLRTMQSRPDSQPFSPPPDNAGISLKTAQNNSEEMDFARGGTKITRSLRRPKGCPRRKALGNIWRVVGTQLLVNCGEAIEAALDALMPVVHNELRHIAEKHLGRERPDTRFKPTALVMKRICA